MNIKIKGVLTLLAIVAGIYYAYTHYNKQYLIKRIIAEGKLTDETMIAALQNLSVTDLRYIVFGGSATVKTLASGEEITV